MLSKIKKKFTFGGQLEIIRIAKNSVFNGGAKLFSKAASLLISMLMARTIGVAGTGQYAIAVTYSGIIYVILNFGIYSIVQREIARSNRAAKEYLSNSLGLFIFISIPLSVVIGLVFLLIFNLNTSVLLMVLACLYSGLNSIFTLISNSLEGIDHFDIECKATVAYNIVTIVGAIPVLFIGRKIEYLLLWFVVIFLCTDIILLLYVNKNLFQVGINFSFKFIRNLLHMSVLLILSSASEYINLKADMLILGYDKGDADTGLYSTAVNIYQGISCIPQAAAGAFTPSFVRIYHDDKQNGKKLFVKTFALFFVFLVAIAFLIVSCSQWLIVILYGRDFIAASVPLAILGIAIIPMELNRFLNNTLIAIGRQRVVGVSVFIGTIFNVVSNIILIPQYSYKAAACTTLATECIVMLIDLFFVINKFRKDNEEVILKRG